MRGSEFAELRAFVMVAECGSFARAAERLGITASAMSQTIRVLEKRLGSQLLQRTTRSVSLTEAGRRLHTRLEPALKEMEAAAREVEGLRETPSGTVRILTPRIAYLDHLEPVLARFLGRFPEVTLDVTVDDALSEIVSHGYDLGIRLGELLEEEVVAIRLGGELRQLAVAAPGYLERRGVPLHPEQLHRHACINWRQSGSSTEYRWEFAKNGQQVAVAVKGPLILNDRGLALRAAVQGAGIAFWAEHRVRPYLDSGSLVAMLEDWSPRFPGFFAYYRRQRAMPPALRVLLDTLKAAAATLDS